MTKSHRIRTWVAVTSALVALLLLVLPVRFAAAEAPDRRAGLTRAWKDPGAVRSVFFVHGMSCRACTMLLDRRLSTTAGLFWARFNFPLRTLTVYHDPRTLPTRTIVQFVAETGELRAELLGNLPASRFTPVKAPAAATWKGGALPLAEARTIPRRFLPTLKQNFLEEGDSEYVQVIYEIVGEGVRDRLLQARAAAAGYASGPPETPLPSVVPRDFYWPAEARQPTSAEAGVARFLLEKVMLGDEGSEGRVRFDRWLLALWRETDLDYRGEYLEAGR